MFAVAIGLAKNFELRTTTRKRSYPPPPRHLAAPLTELAIPSFCYAPKKRHYIERLKRQSNPLAFHWVKLRYAAKHVKISTFPCVVVIALILLLLEVVTYKALWALSCGVVEYTNISDKANSTL